MVVVKISYLCRFQKEGMRAKKMVNAVVREERENEIVRDERD